MDTWKLVFLFAVFTCAITSSANLLESGECELCVKVIKQFQLGSRGLEKESQVKSKIKKICSTMQGREYRMVMILFHESAFKCYYLGGTNDAATSSLKMLATLIQNSIPADRICRKLRKRDAEICDLKIEEVIDLNEINLSTARLKTLKQILDRWGEPCVGCKHRQSYLDKIDETRASNGFPRKVLSESSDAELHRAHNFLFDQQKQFRQDAVGRTEAAKAQRQQRDQSDHSASRRFSEPISSMTLSEYLRHLEMSAYLSSFKEQGVTEVSDISELTYIELVQDIGLPNELARKLQVSVALTREDWVSPLFNAPKSRGGSGGISDRCEDDEDRQSDCYRDRGEGELGVGVQLYMDAAKEGDPVAQHQVGRFYHTGKGVARDMEEAIKWYQKAAEQGYSNAQSDLGYCYKRGEGVQRDLGEAARLFELASAQGHAAGQFNLAWSLKAGQGVDKDVVKAAQLFQLAAEQGHAMAQRSLALCYYNGEGLSADKQKAFEWFKKASLQGDGLAHYGLGMLYLKGEIVTRDDEKSLELFHAAAMKNHASAQHLLAVRYKMGEGVEKDLKRAAELWRAAAEQGHVKAQASLGLCHKKGQGVPQSSKEAVKWYKRAAEGGHALAQVNLAACYAKGEGVDLDKEEAVRWYRVAADNGNALAQASLGACYEKGEGVELNKEEAAKWYRNAAQQGFLQAQLMLGLNYHNEDNVGQQENEWRQAAAQALRQLSPKSK